MIHRDAFWSPGAASHKKTIIWKLKHPRFIRDLDLQVLVIPDPDTPNLLEFFPAIELRQRYRACRNMIVAGVAESRAEAVELTRQIIEEVYRKTGGFSVRSYFHLKER